MAKKTVTSAAAPKPQAVATPKPLPLDPPDARQAYQTLFDTLHDAYWDANDIMRKDQIATVRDHAYDILTALNQTDLATDTVAFVSLSKNIAMTNIALRQIEKDIQQITQRLTTIASVTAAIAKVLSLAPMFAFG